MKLKCFQLFYEMLTPAVPIELTAPIYKKIRTGEPETNCFMIFFALCSLRFFFRRLRLTIVALLFNFKVQ